MTDFLVVLWATDPFELGRQTGRLIAPILLAIVIVIVAVWLWRRRRR